MQGNSDEECVIVVSRDDDGYHLTALYGPRGRLHYPDFRYSPVEAPILGGFRLSGCCQGPDRQESATRPMGRKRL
jgi:hypothetical protein